MLNRTIATATEINIDNSHAAIALPDIKTDFWPGIQMTRKSGRRATVLIADDDPTMLELTAILLQRLGHDVITATDGDSALKVFIETPVPIHLVISDARMPGLKGPQFLQNVRKMSPATATLLISGTQPAPDAGTAWLMKPFRPETLAALIQELLAACDFSRIRREQAALRSSVRTIRGSSSDPPDIVPRSTT